MSDVVGCQAGGPVQADGGGGVGHVRREVPLPDLPARPGLAVRTAVPPLQGRHPPGGRTEPAARPLPALPAAYPRQRFPGRRGRVQRGDQVAFKVMVESLVWSGER